MAVLLHMHSGFPAKTLEQTIVMSLYDVMRVSNATVGGNYKRRPRLSLGAAITVIWVFWHKHLGLQQAQTLSFGCLSAPRVGSISRMQCCLFFNKHVSKPIWRTMSYCDFIYLTAARQTTTSSPWTWYQVKHVSQPFGSKLLGWDKSLVWCESQPVYLVYLCHPQCGPVTYMCTVLYVKLLWCSSIQGMYDQLTGGSIYHAYMCFVLYLLELTSLV